MSQMVKRGQRADEVRMILSGRMRSQLAVALSSSRITADRMIRLVTTSLRRNPALGNASAESIVASVIQAAQLGLEVDNGIGHAYLVPYGGEAQLIVGYRGLVELARRTGEVSTIYAAIVHEHDMLEYEIGLEPKLRHVPAAGDRGLPTHVYAVARLRDGGVQFDVMTVHDVESIRKRSHSGASGNGPWSTDWGEMAKKTVLRRLCKLLPMTTEAQDVLAREDSYDGRYRHDPTAYVTHGSQAGTGDRAQTHAADARGADGMDEEPTS